MELVVPGIGEIVNLEDAPQVARALHAVRALEGQLRDVKSELTNALVYASQVQGSKTLRFEGVEAVVKGGEITMYDEVEIENGLRAAGMPEERIREIVVETVTRKVSAREAERAAKANPAYAKVIEAHRRTVEQSPSVSVKVMGG